MLETTVANAAVLLQVDGVDVAVEPGLGSLLGSAVGAAATTLVVGVLLFALAPEYTDARIAQLEADPLTSFLYGIVFLIGLVAVVVVLFVTLIGIPLAILFALLGYLAWAIGGTIGLVAIAQRLVDDEDWVRVVAVAAALGGALALTGIGGLVSLVVGAAGFGAVVTDAVD